MQVSAHEIVKSFGIDALAKFANDNNTAEIAQCREDWTFTTVKTVCLEAFNDGNNIFEIVFSFQDMKAYRTDSGADVTADYVPQIIEVINRRVALSVAFGVDNA